MFVSFVNSDCFQIHFRSISLLKQIFVSCSLLYVILIYSPSSALEADSSEECKSTFLGIWRNITHFKTSNKSSPVCYLNKPKDLDFKCIDKETISVQRSIYQDSAEFAVTCSHHQKLHFDYDGIAHDVPIMIFKSPEMGSEHEYMLTYSFNASSSNSTGKYTVTTDLGLSTSLYIFFTDSQKILKPDSVRSPIEITFTREQSNGYRRNVVTNIIPCRSTDWNSTVELFHLYNTTKTEKLDWTYDAKIGFFSPSLVENSTLLMCSADYPVNNDSLLFKVNIEDYENTSFVDITSHNHSKSLQEDGDDDSIVKFEKTVATCFGKGSARFHSVVNIHTYNPSESQLYNFINEVYVQQWLFRNHSNEKLPLDNQIKIELCNGAQWCNINDIFPSGLILCLGTENNASFILRQEYFTCLHGVKFPHVKSRELVSFPLEALLQMKLLTELDNSNDEDMEIEVECTAAKYIFMNPNKWTLSYKNFNESIQEMPGDNGLSLEYKHDNLAKTIERKSFKINRNVNASIAIICEATFWDTSYTKSFRLKLPERNPTPKHGFHILVSAIIIVTITAGFLILHFLNRRTKNMLGFTETQIQQFLEGNPQAFYTGKEKRGELLPYDKNFELSEENYEVFRDIILGSGAFGIVYKGRVKEMEAAVKTIKTEKANNEYLAALLSELKIMIYLEKHENIVNLLGASTKDLNIGQAYIFVEYCPLGSLESFLRNHRGKLHKKTSGEGYTIKDLVNWSFQIARGMEHLSIKHIIHGDLATRNVLLKDKHTIKISDFGLSCKLYNYKHYVKKTDSVPLPWRWMSIESLRNLSFSCQSDVWSYGITLWEIFSLGQVPYMCLSWDDYFVEKLAGGLRNQKPVYATEAIYEIMTQCWQHNPNLRPSFANLRGFFNNLLSQWAKESAVSSQSTVAPYVMVKNDLGYTMMMW